jgi:hypothetical protein
LGRNVPPGGWNLAGYPWETALPGRCRGIPRFRNPRAWESPRAPRRKGRRAAAAAQSGQKISGGRVPRASTLRQSLHRDPGDPGRCARCRSRSMHPPTARQEQPPTRRRRGRDAAESRPPMPPDLDFPRGPPGAPCLAGDGRDAPPRGPRARPARRRRFSSPRENACCTPARRNRAPSGRHSPARPPPRQTARAPPQHRGPAQRRR